jgi:hypothetical protein
MKALLVALSCLSICSVSVFGSGVPLPEFVGSYSGAFEPTHCKKGHEMGGGTFTLTVDATGAASGYFSIGLGSAAFAATCSKSGKVVGTYSVLGHSDKVRGKIDKSGQNFIGKATGAYCKYRIVAAKSS